MLAKVNTAALLGIEAYPVTVETDLTRGLPALYTVGLPSATVKEAKERMRSAILNSGYEFPSRRITVNLAPAARKKDGTHFDLPMAICILTASGMINNRDIEKTGFIGELSLDGRIVGVKGALPLVMGMKSSGIKRVFVPLENYEEASLTGSTDIVPVSGLSEAVDIITGRRQPYVRKRRAPHIIKEEKNIDFSDITGQEAAKRAILTAVAGGGHGVFMVGPPGSGKTMLASRIPTIMPDLSYTEKLELTKIYSIAGMLGKDGEVVGKRPFRMPYHSATPAAMFGGGRIPRPGEVSLAHNGVLFLDEFPEFERRTIELLRKPMETGQVMIDRAEEKVVFPSDFMLVAAANPCRCGYYGDSQRQCICTMNEIRNYRKKMYGPVMDRIDIHLKVENAAPSELDVHTGQSSLKNSKMTSGYMKQKVMEAMEIQKWRYRNENGRIRSNADLDSGGIAKYCSLTTECRTLLREAYVRLGLSMRGYDRIVRISRTIADLDNSSTINRYHVAEAIQYRDNEKML